MESTGTTPPGMLLAASFTLLATLSVLALVAANAIARRLDQQPGAEHVLALFVGWHVLVLTPIHMLGVLNRLTAANLAIASVSVDVLAFAIAAQRDGARQLARESIDLVRRSMTSGADTVKSAFRSGPLHVAALGAFVFAMVWLCAIAWLRPSASWDGIWYHDLMVGYAIQNHGYATIDLPIGFIQQANGYPRNAEMTNLWFVIFTDRRLIELPSVLVAFGIVPATALLCRRFAGDAPNVKAVSLMLGIGMLFVPNLRGEMATTYVDGQFTAFQLAAFYYCVRRPIDAETGALAVAALALDLGSKGMALLAVPPLAILLFVRVVWNERGRGWRRLTGFTTTGAAFVTLFGGHAYILNWFHFRNPLWPLTITALGGRIAWKGAIGALMTDLQDNFAFTDIVFAYPNPTSYQTDSQGGGYGLAFGFVLLPVAAIAVSVLAVRLLRSVATRRASAHASARVGWFDADDLCLAALALITLVTMRYSPALWAARYNAHLVAVAMTFSTWLGFRVLRTGALAEGIAATVLVTNVMIWYWSSPGWGVTWPEMKVLAAASARERAGMAPVHSPAMIRARETELGPGDVVFWDYVCPFPALLWNERYENKIQYAPNTNGFDFIDAAEKANARWVAVGANEAVAREIRSRSDRWAEVAPLHAHHETPTIVFRRR